MADVSWGHGDLSPPASSIDPAQPTRIVIASGGSTLSIGDTIDLTATAYYGDGSSVDVTRLGSWSSVDPSIASVNAAGELLGIAVGDVRVSFAYGSGSASTIFTVSTSSSSDGDEEWFYVAGLT